MVDVATVVVGVLVALLIVAIAVAVAFLVAWFLRSSRRRQAYERSGTSHLDLYFDEHFPGIARNFDLVGRARFDSWSSGISSRLSTLSKDLDSLGKARKGLDTRMDRIEKRISDLE